jgi:hypothetical protein
MSVLDRPELVPVPLGYCPCEGTPHADGDIVYLRPDLDPLDGVRAKAIISEMLQDHMDAVAANVELARLWLDIGVTGWTFLDDDGQPIPVTEENIVRALPYAKGGQLVADAADDLYATMVISPLVEKWSELSSDGSTPTPSPTSPNRATRRSQRKPSSTATTDRVPPPA